jgi:hypothetical protein
MGGVLQEFDSESPKREQDVMACNRLRCKMPTKEREICTDEAPTKEKSKGVDLKRTSSS